MFTDTEKDKLTGVYVPGAFAEKLEAKGESHSKGVYMLVHVGGLADVNTRYGHIAGDNVLLGVSDILRNAFEEIPNTLIGRWSGVDFVVYSDAPDFDEMCENIEFKHPAIDTYKELLDITVVINSGIETPVNAKELYIITKGEQEQTSEQDNADVDTYIDID